MLKVWRRRTRRFCTIIPASQFHGVVRMRRGHEYSGLVADVPSALHFKAVLGFIGKRVPVTRVDMTKVALGLDMQTDRFEHIGPEEAVQIPLRTMLVQIILAIVFQQRRLFGGGMLVFMTAARCKIFNCTTQQIALHPVPDHVPDIMQKTGCDQFRFAVRLLGEMGALQSMFELADGFAAVLPGTFIAVKIDDFFDSRNDHDSRLR